MIVHQGIRYWTTQELANSLASRGLIPVGGTPREARRRARRWAAREDLKPTAITAKGGLLWGDDEIRDLLELT